MNVIISHYLNGIFTFSLLCLSLVVDFLVARLTHITLKRETWVTYGALIPIVAGVVIARGVCLVLFNLISLLSFDLLYLNVMNGHGCVSF